MDRYFIYCSTAQIYHALGYNEILSANLTADRYRGRSLSFLSNHFIFITNDKLPAEARKTGVGEEFYPAAVEVSALEESGVMAFFMYEKDGLYQLTTDAAPLGYYAEIEDCKGAFIFGHIPMGALRHIIFESDYDLEQFPNAAPEFWFDHSLYSTWGDPEYRSVNSRSLNLEQFSECCRKVDGMLSQERIQQMERNISGYLHRKAELYFAVKGTENWQVSGCLRGNIDGTLLKLLDAGDKTQSCYHAAEKVYAEYVSAFGALLDKNALNETDDVILNPSDESGKQLRDILDTLAELGGASDSNVSKEQFSEIFEMCRSGGTIFDNGSQEQALDVILNYYTDDTCSMDIDEVLKTAADYPVLKALLIFALHYHRFDVLERGCSKLEQRERRYAYMMFGALNGMMSVDGEWKEQMPLEQNIDQILLNGSDKYLISCLALPENVMGIEPKFSMGMNRKELARYLHETEDEESLKVIYKTCLADDIKLKKISRYKREFKITVEETKKNKVLQELYIRDEHELEKFSRRIHATFDKTASEFSGELFKNEVADSDEFQAKIYERYCKT